MMSIDSTPEITGRKQDGTFERGVSGNPSGRPKGSYNKTTLAAAELLEGQAEALTQKTIDLALDGNITALRIALDRFLPICKSTPITVDLGELKSIDDAHRAFSVIAEALRDGRVSAGDIAALTTLLDQFQKCVELVEFEQRLAVVEEAIQNASKDQFSSFKAT